MNFVTLLGKTTIVSVITSMITYLSYFYLSINAGKSDFGFYSYYQSIMLLLINILPFGTTMAVVVFRYQVGKEEYFNLKEKRIKKRR